MSNTNTIISLPQPKNHGKYSYVLYEELESRYFPSPLPEGTLCWVLKSKGVKGSGAHRAELFLKARVVSDNEGRVLVRYPKGSEYRVRRSNLIPVLEPPCDKIVLVTAETPEYRRACVVHTYRESFLEIGCDFGITVNRVQASLVGAVPQVAGEEAPVEEPRCLGIDKSPESIDIATGRYPDCTFCLGDVFDDSFWDLCQKKLGCLPSVVAVDINGNRELPAVLKCLDCILNSRQELPRLIIVKSRFLYARLLEDKR